MIRLTLSISLSSLDTFLRGQPVIVIVPLQTDVPSLYRRYIACQHLDENDKAPRFRTICCHQLFF
ncbi:TPA: hypothetical protein ACGQSH_002123 [Streptococcus agalactiae]|nr:hypothetical protein [Streptococcus agalactiae]